MSFSSSPFMSCQLVETVANVKLGMANLARFLSQKARLLYFSGLPPVRFETFINYYPEQKPAARIFQTTRVPPLPCIFSRNDDEMFSEHAVEAYLFEGFFKGSRWNALDAFALDFYNMLIDNPEECLKFNFDPNFVLISVCRTEENGFLKLGKQHFAIWHLCTQRTQTAMMKEMLAFFKKHPETMRNYRECLLPYIENYNMATGCSELDDSETQLLNSFF